MTPKEKAEQLVDKFRSNIISFLSDNMKDQNAKQCALIAVEEIEQALTDYGRGDSLELQNMDSEFRYWWKVKEEIEKL